MNRGSISIPIATVGSIILSFVAGVASYYGAMNAQAQRASDIKTELSQKVADTKADLSDKISGVDTKVEVVKADSAQFEKRLDRFENKIDELLKANGRDPSKIQ
jgi:seryl-tRNA synthetase